MEGGREKCISLVPIVAVDEQATRDVVANRGGRESLHNEGRNLATDGLSEGERDFQRPLTAHYRSGRWD